VVKLGTDLIVDGDPGEQSLRVSERRHVAPPISRAPHAALNERLERDGRPLINFEFAATVDVAVLRKDVAPLRSTAPQPLNKLLRSRRALSARRRSCHA
jgi:hypothetical protein